jgi:hypothetical protein
VLNANGATPTFQWTEPPGETAIKYIDTAPTSTAALVPIQPDQLTSRELGFAWTDTAGSGQPVTVTATLPGQSPLTAQVTYNISTPNVTVVPAPEQTPIKSLQCPLFQDSLAMCLLSPSATAGISFLETAVCHLANVNCEWEQVIENASYVTRPGSGQACSLGPQSALDGGGPLGGGGFSAGDSPGSLLPASTQEQTDAASFSTFLMFRANSSSNVLGVFVPVWEIDWQWTGDAYQGSPGNWTIRDGNPATTIPGNATSNYPLWTNIFDPDDPPQCESLPLLTGVAVSPSQVVSGASASITVTLSQAAPAGGAAVQITANSGAFVPQGACNIAGGATTGTCSGTAGGVPGPTPVTLTATYYNSMQTAAITVVP